MERMFSKYSRTVAQWSVSFLFNWTNGEIVSNDDKYLRLAFEDVGIDVAFVELSAERVSMR